MTVFAFILGIIVGVILMFAISLCLVASEADRRGEKFK